MSLDTPFLEAFDDLDGMVDSLVGCQARHDREFQWQLQSFLIELWKGDGVDAVGNDGDRPHAMPQQGLARRLAGGPKRDVAIKPMGDPLLPLADRAEGPRIEGLPDRSQDFMDVGNGMGAGPPRSKPRNA